MQSEQTRPRPPKSAFREFALGRMSECESEEVLRQQLHFSAQRKNRVWRGQTPDIDETFTRQKRTSTNVRIGSQRTRRGRDVRSAGTSSATSPSCFRAFAHERLSERPKAKRLERHTAAPERYPCPDSSKLMKAASGLLRRFWGCFRQKGREPLSLCSRMRA